MRKSFDGVEPYRLRNEGDGFDTKAGEHFGAFRIRVGEVFLRVLVDDGAESGWEHVSVSLRDRCPTWDEMQTVKTLFWKDSETVVQFHPAGKDYVNRHPYCLHLWKLREGEYKLPPRKLI